MDLSPEKITIDDEFKQEVLEKQELMLYRFGNPQYPSTIVLIKNTELSNFFIIKEISSKNKEKTIVYFTNKDRVNIWQEENDTFFLNPMDAIKELILSLEESPERNLAEENSKEQEQLKDGIWKRIPLYQELIKLFNPLTKVEDDVFEQKRKVKFRTIVIESHLNKE